MALAPSVLAVVEVGGGVAIFEVTPGDAPPRRNQRLREVAAGDESALRAADRREDAG
jgi:hypothetical protein